MVFGFWSSLLVLISCSILFIDSSFSSGDETQSNEISIIIVSSELRNKPVVRDLLFFEKKIDFSTNYFKKVDNNSPAKPNFVNFWIFMCSNRPNTIKNTLYVRTIAIWEITAKCWFTVYQDVSILRIHNACLI